MAINIVISEDFGLIEFEINRFCSQKQFARISGHDEIINIINTISQVNLFPNNNYLIFDCIHFLSKSNHLNYLLKVLDNSRANILITLQTKQKINDQDLNNFFLRHNLRLIERLNKRTAFNFFKTQTIFYDLNLPIKLLNTIKANLPNDGIFINRLVDKLLVTDLKLLDESNIDFLFDYCDQGKIYEFVNAFLMGDYQIAFKTLVFFEHHHFEAEQIKKVLLKKLFDLQNFKALFKKNNHKLIVFQKLSVPIFLQEQLLALNKFVNDDLLSNIIQLITNLDISARNRNSFSFLNLKLMTLRRMGLGESKNER